MVIKNFSEYHLDIETSIKNGLINYQILVNDNKTYQTKFVIKAYENQIIKIYEKQYRVLNQK